MKIKTIALTAIMTLCAVIAATAQPSSVTTHTIHSNVLNADRDYTIYLPKNYEADTLKTYPVLYLLHGMWGNTTNWFQHGHAKDVMDLLTANGKVQDMIIVSPNAGGDLNAGEWNGYFDMPGWPYEQFFFEEFIPHLESTYRIRADREGRAVAGLSMGGGGATKYAQTPPDMFCAAYAMSSLMDIPEGDLENRMKNDLRAKLTISVIENSCVNYVKNADDDTRDQLRTVAWYVDCGDDDFLLDRNIEFVQAMHEAKIPVEFRVRDGGHVWEYWRSALYDCLPFVSNTFDRANRK